MIYRTQGEHANHYATDALGFYMCVRDINFELCFYDIPIRFLICSDGIQIYVFYFIIYFYLKF
jgi:hypothetical protein